MSEAGYEISDPITLGGASGQYTYRSPWNTECEWAIISAVGLGTFGFTAPVVTNHDVPQSAGPLTLFSGSGILISAVVTTAGTSNLLFTDGAGNTLGEVLSSAAVGSEISFNNAFFNFALRANNSATTPEVTVFFQENGSNASTASFVIGAKNSKQPTLSATGADSFGSILTSSPDSNNGLPAYVGALTSNAPFVTYSGDAYMPLPAPADIYLTTNTPAQTEVLVTIQFRRSLDHVIPETPRARPSTHSQPLPRKGSRTFIEGFAARSDLASEPYHHQPLSAQETGETVGRFGKLAPTNIKHRGVAKNGR